MCTAPTPACGAAIVRVACVVGARPNFMKMAPLLRAMADEPRLQPALIHTGQHYDEAMSEVFFDELGIRAPDHHLGVGSGSHAEQTARVMTGFERFCNEDRPHLVVVVGDINSTLAAALVAKKAGVAVAHVEAGLRSGDMSMPEEVNRRATDAISDLLFATERSAVGNLLREGHSVESIHLVGNVMIDNLYEQVDKLSAPQRAPTPYEELKSRYGRYGVVTLHRPANVDDPGTLTDIVRALSEISRELPLFFPAHPRTQRGLQAAGIELPDTIVQLPPLPHLAFLNLWRDALVVLTDSGGVQEETTALGVRCITIRDNTERPITVEQGTNRLAGITGAGILAAYAEHVRGPRLVTTPPPLWDGRSAQRIVEVLRRRFLPGPIDQRQMA